MPARIGNRAPDLSEISLNVPCGIALSRAVAALLLLLAVPAAGEVGVVRCARSARPAVARRVQDPTAVIEAALDRAGIRYRRFEEARLTDAGLRPYDVIVLPCAEVGPAAAEALHRFRERGGRWIAYAPTGPASLDALLGLKPAAEVEAFSPRALVPHPRPGMPARVPIAAGAAIIPRTPADPSYEAGRWDPASGLASLVRGPHGYFVNARPAGGEAHADLLLAMLADVDPRLWHESLQATRRRAVEAMRDAAARWTYMRNSPDVTDSHRSRIEAELRLQRGRIPPSDLPSVEIESNQELLASRIQDALAVEDAARQACFRMAASRKGEVRATWIYKTEHADWDAVVRQVRDAGLNTLFVRVGRGGSVIYDSQVLPTEDWAVASDELKAAVDAARKYGIALHAWKICFNLAGAAPAFRDRMSAEDRLARDAQGRQGRSLNPGDPRNADQELRAVLEVVSKYDLEGVHLDHFQYPDDPHEEWDYGPVSRREFEKASGVAVAKWPDDVVAGARKAEYENWERDNLSRLLQRIYSETKKMKPHVQVSAAVWRNHRRYRATVKQDWPRWAQAGTLDFIVPLNYTPEQETHAAAVEAQVSAARGRVAVVSGIGAYLLADPMDVLRQVEASREQGADGFALFALNHDGIENQLAAIRSGATAEATWPATVAPHFDWGMSPGLDRKDAPAGYAAGDRLFVEVKVTAGAPGRSALKTVRGEIRLEDGEGRLVSVLGPLDGFGSRKFKAEAPGGRFRPVARGNMSFADGVVRPFVVRGPLCDGLGGDELAALRARADPPAPGAGLRVGVYAGGLGAAALLALLREGPMANAVPVHRLQPEHLAPLESLVLPQAEDVEELSPAAVQALRQWVEAGGTLLLTHDAVGLRWHPRLFPEVGVGREEFPGRSLSAARAVGALKLGDTLEHAYRDHIRITPGPAGEVILREPGENGAPVVVVGKVGKGRVILYGPAAGHGSVPMEAEEKALLRALLASPG